MYIWIVLVLGSLLFRLCSFNMSKRRRRGVQLFKERREEEEEVAYTARFLISICRNYRISYDWIWFKENENSTVWLTCVWVSLYLCLHSTGACCLWITECIMNSDINSVHFVRWYTLKHTAKKSLTPLLLLFFVCSHCGKFWHIE